MRIEVKVIMKCRDARTAVRARSGGLEIITGYLPNMPMSERRQCGSEVNGRSSADGQRITKNVTGDS